MFGENRVQEAEGKWPALKAEFADLELHLIGPLQTNKARDAVALFDVIQSVDPIAAGWLSTLAKEMETRRPATRVLRAGQYRRGGAEGRRPAEGRRSSSPPAATS